MKTKTAILVIIFTAFSFSAFAQMYLKSAEENLVQTLQKLRSPNVETDIKSVSKEFETSLKKLLKEEASWIYTFPELRKYIDIKTSKDKKIRTFSWDSRLGGSWHDLQTLIQHQTKDGIHVFKLQNKTALTNETEASNEAYRDAAIIHIYSFHKGYLFEGIGTHGSGHHHKVFMYYELQNDILVPKEIFENNQSIYVHLIPRRYDFDVEVDVAEKTITHSEFVLDNEIGFYMPTQKKVILTFDGKQFKKTIKTKKP